MKTPFLLSLLLPRKRATEETVRRALIECRVDPDAIAWRVDEDGRFAFGRKHPDDAVLTSDQIQRMMDWTQRERIKVGFIAWETNPS